MGEGTTDRPAPGTVEPTAELRFVRRHGRGFVLQQRFRVYEVGSLVPPSLVWHDVPEGVEDSDDYKVGLHPAYYDPGPYAADAHPARPFDVDDPVDKIEREADRFLSYVEDGNRREAQVSANLIRKWCAEVRIERQTPPAEPWREGLKEGDRNLRDEETSRIEADHAAAHPSVDQGESQPWTDLARIRDDARRIRNNYFEDGLAEIADGIVLWADRLERWWEATAPSEAGGDPPLNIDALVGHALGGPLLVRLNAWAATQRLTALSPAALLQTFIQRAINFVDGKDSW